MCADAAPRWKRLGPDARREQILAAGKELFSQKPYAAVSTTELADAAGITRGLMHHYFGTKRELYLEVVGAMLTIPTFEDLVVPEGDRTVRAAFLVDQMLGFLKKHGAMWVTVGGTEGMGPDPEVQELLDSAEDAAAATALAVIGFQGNAKQRREALTALRAYSSLVRAIGRELVLRKSISRPTAQRLLVAALLSMLDELEKSAG